MDVRQTLRRCLLLCPLVLASLASVAGAQSWEFATDGDAQSWQALHGVHDLQVRDGHLELCLDPSDPYLWTGDTPLNLPAADAAVLEVKMKTDAWGILQVYWVTGASPEWYGPDRKRVSCKLTGDGAWHTYRVRLGRHPAWKGTITHLRVDPVEGYPGQPALVHASIDYIRLVQGGENCCFLSRPLAEKQKRFQLLLRVFNDSAEPLSGVVAELVSTTNAQRDGCAAVQAFPPIAAGRGAWVQWQLQAGAAGPAGARAEVRGARGARGETLVVQRDFLVSEPCAVGSGDAAPGDGTRNTPAPVVVGTSAVRVVFPSNVFGFGRGEFQRYDKQRARWIGLARMRCLSRLVSGDSGCSDQDIYAPAFEGHTPQPGQQEVIFRNSVVDGSGTVWDCYFSFATTADDDLIRMRYTATPDRDASLYRLDGPLLYVGESTCGSQKRAAVLPGLEFLQGDQESSSLRDFSNEWRFRMAPHPLRVTIPASSITTQDGTVSLFWDPHFRWNGLESGMTAMFASPNRVADWPGWQEAGDNHLLGLFVPSIPRYVPEHDSVADTPYVAPAGRPLTLEAAVWLSASTDPTAAVQRYVARHGLPAVVPPPCGMSASRQLCRTAYLETLWNAHQRGWKPYAEMGDFVPDPWIEMLLRLEARTAAGQVRTALLTRADDVAAARRSGPLGGDPTWTKTPYFLGLFDGQTLKWLEAEVREALRTQQPNGSWRYVPLPLPAQFAHCPPLGRDSDVSVFQTAVRAGQLLRWTSITGDAQAQQAGLKVLEYLASGHQLVPQGAPFEDPAASPYLWSSGLAVEAFLAGYRATGNADLLSGARYWARTGLPFVYLWNVPEAGLQRYATIGVFGSSYYDHASWLGRPVQWLGLEYAYALRKLAPHDASCPWTTIADGITASALWQLGTQADQRGLYPDSVEGAGDLGAPGFTVRYGPWIQPDLILKNLLAADGHDPEISFQRVGQGAQQLWITSGAQLGDVRLDEPETGDLSLVLHAAAGDQPCTVIAGFGRPRRVVSASHELPETPTGTGAVPEGWMFDAARDLLYLKTRCPGPDLTIRLARDAGRP